VKIETKLSALSFFDSIPDDVLVNIAMNDWEALKRLCIALTLDIQLIKEEIEKEGYENSSDRGNMC
jgi:hypothetical protein